MITLQKVSVLGITPIAALMYAKEKTRYLIHRLIIQKTLKKFSRRGEVGVCRR